MKYPISINIRGYEYRIEYLEHPREVDRDFEDDNFLGTCDSETIRVLATQPLNGVLETLIHETLHVHFTRNKMLKAALKQGMEEWFITTLAADLAHTLLTSGLVKFPAKGPPITTRIHPEALP